MTKTVKYEVWVNGRCVDVYNTREGAEHHVEMAKRMGSDSAEVREYEEDDCRYNIDNSRHLHLWV